MQKLTKKRKDLNIDEKKQHNHVSESVKKKKKVKIG